MMQVKTKNCKTIQIPASQNGGWPWQSHVKSYVKAEVEEVSWPKISVITPSFNQGHFIEETTRSVLLQGYPNLEYIIMDGGSTDCTLDVIHKYEPFLTRWVSEKDSGQAHAINKGFRLATGEIVAWLNSDDLYLPGALFAVAEAFHRNPSAEWMVGNVEEFNTGNPVKGEVFTRTITHDLIDWVTRESNIHQPGVFWKRELLHQLGELNQEWHYCFDAEFWCRLIANEKFPVQLDDILARFRLHPNSKTCSAITRFYRENIELSCLYEKRFSGVQRLKFEHYLTYFKFTIAKLEAQAFIAQNRPMAAIQSLLKAMYAEPKLVFRGSLFSAIFKALCCFIDRQPKSLRLG